MTRKKLEKIYGKNNVEEFKEGRAIVELNDKKGHVDLDGKVTTPIIYDEAGYFHEGRVWVKLNKKDGLVYKSVSQLMISDVQGLTFYSFIQPSLYGNFSMHTAVEKSDLRYFRRLNEKEETVFNAKVVLSKK